MSIEGKKRNNATLYGMFKVNRYLFAKPASSQDRIQKKFVLEVIFLSQRKSKTSVLITLVFWNR